MRTASVRLTLAALAVSLVLAPAAPAGQEFVHWLASAPTSLDPAKSGHIQDDQIMWLLYDALTQLSPDGKQMLPALAERWQASADGLTYTFSLRKNVHFHDGTLLDADAVRISYERQYLRGSPQYSPAPPNAYETVLSGFIKELRVLDRHRVAITTRYARPHQFALVKIVSPQALAGHAGDLSRTPVGTGPFQLERWEAGQVTLVPFARTWHGRARLHLVRFTATSNNDEAMERLGAGEIDLLHNVPPDFFEELRGNPRIALRKYGGLNTMFLGMQMDRPGLRDQRVREAIVRAVNRERMAAVL
ncbi:MAG: hypothetical protein EHM24_33610, partial [Acidobacteria bacterium]